MTLKEAMESMARTLETVTVSGKENLSRLLGCMQLLETMLDAMGKEEMQDDGNSERENMGG